MKEDRPLERLLGGSALVTEARLGNRRGSHWAVELLVFALVFFIAAMLEGMVQGIGGIVLLFTGGGDLPGQIQSILAQGSEGALEALTRLLLEQESLQWLGLYSTVLASAAVLFYCRVIQGRSWASMGFRARGAGKEYLLGLGIGAALISAAVLLGAVTGLYRLGPAGGGWLLPVYFGGYLLQGLSEEIACRGYLMLSLSRRNSLWLSLLLSALVFSLLHVTNPGFGPLPFLNLLLYGLSIGLYMLKRGSIWGAAAIHSIWNFLQGNFYGISVSGTGLSASVLSCTPVRGLEWLTGGGFGIEGGVLTTVVELAFLGIALALPEKKEPSSAA